MRASTSLLLVAACALQQWVADSHPLCYFGDRPTDPEQVLSFCPMYEEGACCNDEEEVGVQDMFEAAIGITGDCADLYKEAVCGICNPYSGHLYAELADELGVADGLMMTNEFCESMVTACDGQLIFPTYDGTSYCEKHTGTGDGDAYWSYPWEPVDPPPLDLEELFLGNTGLPDKSLVMAMSPDSSVWWIGGREGQLVEVPVDDKTSSSLVLDLRDSTNGPFYEAFEEGLLGFAFSPVFSSNSRFYVAWNIGTTSDVINRLSMFVKSSTAAATLASEEVLVESSVRSTSIHAGGWVGFKPSDYGNGGAAHDLYWAIGDSGPQQDTEQHGQNIDDIHATVVRITVPATGTGYSIPDGNLVGGVPEICAYGFRNPWRCGFDRQTDELRCGDVGHTDVESIYEVKCGSNYGWSRFEGSLCQAAAEPWLGSCDGVDRSGFEFPLFEYCHPDFDSSVASQDPYTDGVDICNKTPLRGHAVVGGYVYRGAYFEETLGGAYVFGDHQNKNVYYLKEVDGVQELGTIISDGSMYIISFAEDNNGELYVIDYNWKIYPMPCGDLCASTCLDQTSDAPTFESLGCWTDNAADRVLSLQTAPNCPDGETAMSPQICADYCATIPGAEIFGVEFYFQCFCGTFDDAYDRYGELEDSDCTYLCSAFPEFFCGGSNAIEVFQLNPPEPTPAPMVVVIISTEAGIPPNTVFPQQPISIAEPTPSPTIAITSEEPTSVAEPTLSPGAIIISTEQPLDDPAPAAPTSPAPPTGPTETPPPVPGLPYMYVGCFVDSATDRVLSGPSLKGQPDMSAENCAGFCSDAPYFGTEFGGECFCAVASDDPTSSEPATNCNVECTGEPDEICGGSNAISVYQNNSGGGPTTAPVGCFIDVQSDRIMTEQFIDSAMTLELCESLCQGFTFYGVQYGVECWCGPPSAEYEKHGVSTGCTMACAGDAAQICGGNNAMTVYEY